jgi:hypothetical protein
MAIKSNSLPDKPSELLKVALADLEAVEGDSRYNIDLLTWHEPNEYGDGRCVVCLAGSVMAKSLGADIELDLGPSAEDLGISIATSNKLYALNNFRIGLIRAAYKNLNRAKPDSLPDYVEMSSPHWVQKHGEAKDDSFKCSIRRLIELLESEGE